MAKAKTFEESITELEKIVKTLENGDTPLDNAIALFEKGMKLSAKCHEQLEKATQKIKILTEGEDGTISQTDFANGEEQ